MVLSIDIKSERCLSTQNQSGRPPIKVKVRTTFCRVERTDANLYNLFVIAPVVADKTV